MERWDDGLLVGPLRLRDEWNDCNGVQYLALSRADGAVTSGSVTLVSNKVQFTLQLATNAEVKCKLLSQYQ